MEKPNKTTDFATGFCHRLYATISSMQTVIILATHGMPPHDYPKKDLAEFFRLYSMVESMGQTVNAEIQQHFNVLHEKMRRWPRTEKNDPFNATSQELAARLSEKAGCKVIVGYNEFCAPALDEALQTAVDNGARKIIIATTMLTGGGEHAEKEIPEKLAEFRERNPRIEVTYAWPYDKEDIVGFIGNHLKKYL